MNSTELIEEAKRRYPIGTKFYPAHISQEEIGIVPTDGEIRVFENYIGIFNPFGTEYRTTPAGWCMVLKHNDKWAEIVSLPTPQITNSYDLF